MFNIKYKPWLLYLETWIFFLRFNIIGQILSIKDINYILLIGTYIFFIILKRLLGLPTLYKVCLLSNLCMIKSK